LAAFFLLHWHPNTIIAREPQMSIPFTPQEMLAIVVGASFAAGLNVYATVAVLGLLARAELFSLPPSLHVVQAWPTIAAAITLFIIEFFADKVPAFDLIWNALQTFVRVPVAGLLAYGATAQLSPGAQLASAVLASGIAFASHGGKTAIRAVVTPSPEPVSNIGLSLTEDALAIGLVWFATRHPYAAAIIVAVLLVLLIITIRLISKSLRALFHGARAQWQRLQLE
jgi:uncharacterized protein DUF4126